MRDRAASPSVDYAALFDAVPEPMLVLDATGRIRAVNGAWRRFAKDNGADETTTLGVGLDYLAACMKDPGGEEVVRGLLAVLEGRQPYFEHAYRCNSPNELRRCLLRAAQIPGPAPGLSGGAFLAHLDVTGRELAEERLYVQRRVASSLAAGRPVLDVCTELAELVCERLEWDHWELWGLDAVGRPRLIKVPDPAPHWLADFLPATRGITLEPGQGLPGRVWSRRHAEWVAGFDDKAMPRGAAAQRCGLQSAFAIPLVAGDETVMALCFYSRLRRAEDRVTTELVTAIGAQIAGVARRLRAEELARSAELELEQGRAHLYSVLEHAPGHVIEVDGEGRIRYLNRAFTVPREQTLGMRWTWTAPQGERARLDALFDEVMHSGAPRDFQLELLDADGKPRSFQGRIGPLWRAEVDQAKTVVGAVIVIQDVTEVRRLQAELDTTQRLASVGTLAAGVAHEINNPLSSVIANLSLALGEVGELLNAGVQAPELLGELEDARAGAERIRGVARDLKVLARPKDEPTGPVEVVPLLESMLRLANNEIRHRAQVVRDYEDVPPVEASDGRLGQVVLNLLLNAAQAIPEGNANRNRVRVATRKAHDGAVCIEVSDSGPGIPAEVMPRLFEPFFTTKEGSGTGLGLAICEKIVRGFNGRITAESVPGQGACFRVYLPVARPEARRFTPAGFMGVGGPVARARVLVIDDEPSIGIAMRRALARAHEVTVVQSARDALSLLARGPGFDVIFCDLMMPEMTGPDLLELLAQQRPEELRKVILITGGAFSPRTRAFLDQTSHLVIEKPFSPQQLLGVVAERMRNSH